MTLPPLARHYGYMSQSVQTRDRAATLLRRAARLAERATTPLLPADYLDLFDPLRPGADLRGRIVEVQPETADAATIAALVRRRQPGAVDLAGWQAIDREERRRGAEHGRPRVKIVDIDEMLRIAREQARRPMRAEART